MDGEDDVNNENDTTASYEMSVMKNLRDIRPYLKAHGKFLKDKEERWRRTQLEEEESRKEWQLEVRRHKEQPLPGRDYSVWSGQAWASSSKKILSGSNSYWWNLRNGEKVDILIGSNYYNDFIKVG